MLISFTSSPLSLSLPSHSHTLAGLADADDAPAQFPPSEWPAAHARFERLFASRSRDEWTAVFAALDACVEPVLTLDEVRRESSHAFLAADGVDDVPAPWPRLSASPVTTPRRRPPANGEHTRDVLADVMSEAQIEQLLASGAAKEARAGATSGRAKL